MRCCRSTCGAKASTTTRAEGGALRAEVGGEIKAAKIREFNTLGVVLGYHYSGSPIVVDDGSAPPPRALHRTTCLRRIPAASRRMPGSTTAARSTTTSALASRCSSPTARAPSVNTRVPLKVLREPSVRDLYQARYALIRPDQHVAWRGDALSSDIFDRITGRASAPAREAVTQSGTGT